MGCANVSRIFFVNVICLRNERTQRLTHHFISGWMLNDMLQKQCERSTTYTMTTCPSLIFSFIHIYFLVPERHKEAYRCFFRGLVDSSETYSFLICGWTLLLLYFWLTIWNKSRAAKRLRHFSLRSSTEI